MNTILDLDKFSREDKLRAMEELWADLTRSSDQYPSPEWHRDALKERESALQTGQDEFISWEDAKKSLRERNP